MRKWLIPLVLYLMCLNTLAGAEWADQIEWPVEVTDPILCQELEVFARSELAHRYPELSDAQLANFMMDDVYTYLSRENWWSVSLHYDGCESVQMNFDVIRASGGELEVEWVLPWDIEALVQLYDSCITREDALAVGRISLAVAMSDFAEQYPGDAKAAVDYYGLAMLDPAGFLTHAWFCSPLNQGGDDVRWALHFVLPVDPEAGPDGEMNPLWYRVDIDAVTGAVMHETIDYMFSIPQDAR